MYPALTLRDGAITSVSEGSLIPFPRYLPLKDYPWVDLYHCFIAQIVRCEKIRGKPGEAITRTFSIFLKSWNFVLKSVAREWE
jgi:hypothetical protein